MQVKRYFLPCTPTFFGFVSCTKERPQWVNKVAAIKTEQSVYETYVGEFNYESVTVLAEYLDGKVEKVALTEAMLSETDREKENRIGEHTVTVLYENQTCHFVLIVMEDESELIEFLDKQTVYSGAPQSILVGNLPAKATVE